MIIIGENGGRRNQRTPCTFPMQIFCKTKTPLKRPIKYFKKRFFLKKVLTVTMAKSIYHPNYQQRDSNAVSKTKTQEHTNIWFIFIILAGSPDG